MPTKQPNYNYILSLKKWKNDFYHSGSATLIRGVSKKQSDGFLK